MSTGNIAPEPHGPTPHEGISWRRPLIMWTFFVIVPVVLYVGWSWFQRSSRVTEDSKEAIPKLASDVKKLDVLTKQMEATRATVQAELDALRQKEKERISTSAVSLARLAKLRSNGAEFRERFNRLNQATVTWTTKFLPLLTNEDGKRLAASPPHREFCITMFMRPRPTSIELETWREQLYRLLDPIDEAVRDKDADFRALDEHQRDLISLGQLLRQKLDEMGQDRLLLETLLAETAAMPAGKETLDDVLKKRLVDEAKANAGKVADARRHALEQVATHLAEQEEKKVAAAIAEQQETFRIQKIESDAILATMEAKARMKKTESDREAIALNAKAKLAEDVNAVHKKQAEDKAKLETEFATCRSEINSLLRAFTSPGFKHRDDQTKGPASFGLIQGNGALAPTRPGMEKLQAMGTQNDRPLGSLPKWEFGGDYNWARTDQNLLARAQTLLRTFGPLMVEKSLLAP